MATVNRSAILAAVVAAGGQLGRAEIAAKLNMTDSSVTSAVNGAIKQHEELLRMNPDALLDFPGGKKIKVSDYVAKCEERYGKYTPPTGDEKLGKLAKLVMRDKRGRASLTIAEKMGLDDLEI